MQQPAVSASIRQLETSLGVVLFARRHKRIELTAAGVRLYSDVARALELVHASARSVQQFARNDYVTLNASSAFNNYWIMPRLIQLHQLHPDIDLRLQTSDREPDLEAENISLAVRRGTGHWPGYEAALIAQEEIYPVAAPHVMERAAEISDVAELLSQSFIHLEEPIRERPTWEQWFSHFGAKVPASFGGLRLNDYALVLQAAMAGEGFAFGWGHVTRTLVQQGVLAARKEWTWRTGAGFYLVWSKRRPLPQSAIHVRDWILNARPE